MKDAFGGIFNNRKVLITGDTGFKGSWLSIWLSELGAKVYGYSLPAKSDQDNFIKTRLSEKINHRTGDINNLEELTKYFQEVRPDMAFHLAAQSLVLESYKTPLETFQSNVMGTAHFLEAVRKTESIKSAVIVTTDKCYQNNEWVWGYRENEALGGKDPYSASKACAELVTHAYISSFFGDKHSCRIATARAGNVIGGGDWAENRIVPDFFRAYLLKQKMLLRNPSAVRPWQHVLEPLCGYLTLASRLYDSGGEKFSGAWNFGPLESNHYTVSDLIEKMISVFGSGEFYTPFQENKPHEANLLKLDISKAMNILHWKPLMNFEQTVRFTVRGYQMEFESLDLYDARVSQIREYQALLKNEMLMENKI